jgi:uroporphyrinogen decarboxylase
MNPKENYLEAILFSHPDYVPMTNEPIGHSISFDGIVKMDNWKDRWGVEWKLELEGMVPFPKGNPLADISKLADYQYPDPDGLLLPEHVKDDMKRIDRGAMLIHGNMSYLLFERAWALMGMENFMMALMDYPDEMHVMLHNIAIYARRVFDRYLDMGVDIVGFSEDLGSQRALMISPVLFKEFLLPEYVYIFENVKKEGKMVNFHSCGCVDAIAEDLASIGVTMLNPVQAKANDLIKLKRATRGRMALVGGIDTDLLLRGTPEDVKKEAIRVLEILKPGGGYVCGPDQYFPNIPISNLDALWDVVKSYGKY